MIFTATCCSVSKPTARSYLPKRMIFDVDLSKTLERLPLINEGSVSDLTESAAECESAIMNSLIVGEVRRPDGVHVHRGVVSRGS